MLCNALMYVPAFYWTLSHMIDFLWKRCVRKSYFDENDISFHAGKAENLNFHPFYNVIPFILQTSERGSVHYLWSPQKGIMSLLLLLGFKLMQ